MKKYIIAFVVLLAVILCARELYYITRPDGSTAEIREEMINGFTHKWEIVTESELNGYILCGIYSEDRMNGIAVFEPVGDGKYKLVSKDYRESDEIVVTSTLIDGEMYTLVWFNGEKGNAVHNHIKPDGQTQTVVFDAENVKIVYYDDDGNVYQ